MSSAHDNIENIVESTTPGIFCHVIKNMFVFIF